MSRVALVLGTESNVKGRPTLIAICLMSALLISALPARGAAEASRGGASQPVLEVFVAEGCPHCAAAKAFLSRVSAERRRLRIVYRSVNDDATAREDLLRVSQNAGIWPPGVPTFVVDGRVLVGFDDADHSGPAVLSLIDEVAPAEPHVETRLFGSLSASRLGLPLFTVAIGLLDGFNPCAMWVLLFLLSVLLHLRDRRRMALIAGTFVLVSGAVYYAFMAA